MPRRAALQEVLNAYAELQRIYAAAGVRAQAPALRTLANLSREIVAVVAAGTSPDGAAVANETQLLRLIESMDRALVAARRDYAAAYRAVFKDAADTVLSQTPRLFQVFGTSTVGRLEAAREAFILEARGSIYNAGYTQWIERFQNAGSGLKASMQRTLIEGQLNGWSQRQIAQSLLRTPEFSFKNLPAIGPRGEKIFTLGGKLSPSDALIRRAHTIARTELTGTIARMHTSWTQEAGFDKYVTMNAEPVSEICQEAVLQPPMTLDEWQSWALEHDADHAWPFHVNCDSEPMAVPGDYEDALAEATLEELTA